jgi:hypothetical protein
MLEAAIRFDEGRAQVPPNASDEHLHLFESQSALCE